jgi:hypothetical protein
MMHMYRRLSPDVFGLGGGKPFAHLKGKDARKMNCECGSGKLVKKCCGRPKGPAK